jgi:putative phage-type endonuclease
MKAYKLVSYFLDKFPEMKREDWLTGRFDGIGGSEIGTILGVNKWQTPYQLYHQKKGDTIVEENNAMRRGKILEPLVADIYTEKTGNIVYPCGSRLFKHPEFAFIRGTPDYLIVTPDNRIGVLEIKTSFGYGAIAWENGIPESNILQSEYYMSIVKDSIKALFDVDIDVFCHLAWFVNDNFDYAEIKYDIHRTALIYSAAALFWGNIQKNIEPMADTYDDVRDKYKQLLIGKIVDTDETNIELLNLLVDRANTKSTIKMLTENKMDEVKGELKVYSDMAEEIDKEIVRMVGDAEEIRVNGITVVTRGQNKRKMKFDVDACILRYPLASQKFISYEDGPRVLRYKDKEIEKLIEGIAYDG